MFGKKQQIDKRVERINPQSIESVRNEEFTDRSARAKNQSWRIQCKNAQGGW